MCNGTSTRMSQGGSIAVLRPTRHLPLSAQPNDEMRLFFHNRLEAIPGHKGTHVEFQGWQAHDQEIRGRSWVVIHRDGDLSAASQGLATTANPLFSFEVVRENDLPIQLARTLDLSVGDEGIIGRRVSVVRGSASGSVTVAEGIIGWN